MNGLENDKTANELENTNDDSGLDDAATIQVSREKSGGSVSFHETGKGERRTSTISEYPELMATQQAYLSKTTQQVESRTQSRASGKTRSPDGKRSAGSRVVSRASTTRSRSGKSGKSTVQTAEFIRSVPTSYTGSPDGKRVADPVTKDFEEVMSDSDTGEELGRGPELLDSDYDTDLEMDPDKWLFPERYEHDTTGRNKYIKACQEYGVQPVRFFLRNMQEDNLYLRHHGLGPNAIKALAIPLENNTTIEAMDLEGNWILEDGTIQLCRVLRENVYVTRLNLAENQIGNDGAIAVCNLLMSNKHIDHLNLAGNSIGNSTIEYFYNVLTQTGTSLKQLNLSHNMFDDVAAQRFKDMLMENEHLEVFDISWNHFQSKGCVLLAQGVAENVGLKELAVSMNGFGLEGGKALGKALQNNRTLLRLEAAYCRLPTECATELAIGLVNTDKLTVLDLSYNCLDAESVLVLLGGVQRNESSELLFFNLGNTRVNRQFKELQDKLSMDRGLVIHHGGVNEDYKDHVADVDPFEAFKRDPMTKLKEWLASAGYRIIDLFRHFDKDQSMSISVKEFKEGIASTKIPMTEMQVDMLIHRLDKDGDGEIDFSELMDGDKTHRKIKRDIDKFVQEQDEKAKEREREEREKEKMFEAAKKRNSIMPNAAVPS